MLPSGSMSLEVIAFLRDVWTTRPVTPNAPWIYGVGLANRLKIDYPCGQHQGRACRVQQQGHARRARLLLRHLVHVKGLDYKARYEKHDWLLFQITSLCYCNDAIAEKGRLSSDLNPSPSGFFLWSRALSTLNLKSKSDKTNGDA